MSVYHSQRTRARTDVLNSLAHTITYPELTRHLLHHWLPTSTPSLTRLKMMQAGSRRARDGKYGMGATGASVMTILAGTALIILSLAASMPSPEWT